MNGAYVIALLNALIVADFILYKLSLAPMGSAEREGTSWYALLIAMIVVTGSGLLTTHLIARMVPLLRHPERLDVMVREAILVAFSAFLVVLLALNLTPLPRWLGIHSLDGWEKLLTAGGIVTLSAAIVGLVISYRKQRDAEDSKFNSEFAAAASQLGGDSASVRIAGVYAMAALADQHLKRRQQCIDVLCGHLRIPYDPQDAQSGLTERSATTTNEHIARTSKYLHMPGEREVRLTIIKVIREHLVREAPVSWHGYDFDFTGAVFDGGSFEKVSFEHSNVLFTGAKFTSGSVSFQQARFSSGSVSFRSAQFLDGSVFFTSAQFNGASVSFRSAKFLNADVRFDVSNFRAGSVDFAEAYFLGGSVSYVNSYFGGASVTYDNAKFVDGRVKFAGVEFIEGIINFDFIEVEDCHITFDMATCSNQVELYFTDVRVPRDSVLKDGKNFLPLLGE